MARQSANFFDLHAEKLAVALCAAVLGGAGVFALGGFRFRVDELGPSALVEATDQAARQTRDAILSARPRAPAETPTGGANDQLEQIRRWFDPQSGGLLKIAGLPETLPRAVPFPPPMILGQTASAEERRRLVKLVPPGLPVVVSGRATITDYVDADGNKLPVDEVRWEKSAMERKEAVRSFVSVGAQVDLAVQEANFIAEHYPPGSHPLVVSVQLQRKDADDPAARWEFVEPWVPYRPFARPTLKEVGGRLQVENLAGTRSLIELCSEFIARPKLAADRAVDVPLPYLDEPPPSAQGGAKENDDPDAARRAKKWLDLARAALEGKRPFKEKDPDAALILARAAAATKGLRDKDKAAAAQLLRNLNSVLPKNRRSLVSAPLQSPERLMPIVAHDVTAVPGHRYVYRMRYEVLNIYAGNPGELVDPDDARRITLFSDWSPPSRPIEVESDTCFFLTKADAARKEITVAVYKTGRRGVESKEYRITQGDEIGRKEKRGSRTDFSTGCVCVHIDFSRTTNGKEDVVLVYVDTADGSLHEKHLSRDRKSSVLRRLIETKTARP